MKNIIAFTYAIITVLKKYSNVEGGYERTLLQGVQHYLCDSGIYTDAFSAKDAKLVYATHGCESDAVDVDAWHEAVRNMELECNKVLEELFKIYDEYGVDEADLANIVGMLEDELL